MDSEAELCPMDSEAELCPMDSEAELLQINARLRAGHDARRQLRIRVSGTALAVSVLLAVVVVVPMYAYSSLQEYNAAWLCRTDWDTAGLVCTFLLSDLSSLLSLLAPLPDDMSMTLAVTFANFCKAGVLLYFSYRDTLSNGPLCDFEAHSNDCIYSIFGIRGWCYAYHVSIIVANCSILIVWGFAMFLGLCGASVALVQKMMWKAAFLYYAADLSVGFPAAVAALAHGREFDGLLWCSNLVDLASIIVVMSDTIHDRIHFWLARLYKTRGELFAAAGVAGLVGDCEIHVALSQAKERFRSIRGEHLTYEMLLSASSTAVLNIATEPLKLGTCDAFISHSWHDEPEAKWRALQKWRSTFTQQAERDPSLWLDRCCIDQYNIDCDLRCLPIFLSGCKELILLVGPTYLRRLWCVVELLTFVHMEGDTRRIVLMQVLRAGREESDLAQIQREFLTFRVEDCECSDATDRARLFAIIRMAFGTTSACNKVVRKILQRAKLRRFVDDTPRRFDAYTSDTDCSSSEDDWSESEGAG
eukprot:TRINITY_DN4831_c0_g1_i1.p1 TRINITY_DN4831_c0_g1~~TRINITY_DN4831_c0_g1_i1.p1  ORF type:complete len:531 (+),score=57.87 TRINITY_DN4831_c0_g1_i1:85-1677(+)